MPANCSIKDKSRNLPIQIIPATPASLPELAAIERDSFSHPWTLAQFQSELAKPYSHTLVAVLQTGDIGVVVGYVVFWLIADELHLLNLAVAPAWRRRGIGYRLLTFVLQQAREAGAEFAWLEVRPSNTAALALYHSLGFYQVMVRKRYYAETGEDALILMLPLTPLGEAPSGLP